jgi:hypothetical protein
MLLFCAAVSSCSQQKGVSSYTDTAAFFETQIAHLTNQNKGIHKKMTFGNKVEDITLSNADWKKELSSFSQVELNKPSYNGRFDIDTVRTDEHIYSVRYRSNDPKIDLREVDFAYANDQIHSVKMIIGESNSLYNASKTLIYDADSGYSIEGTQEVSLGSPATYSVKAVFTNP